MTRKNYRAAAKLIQGMRDRGAGGAPIVEKVFVEFFQADNPAFDVDRFRKACSIPHE